MVLLLSIVYKYTMSRKKVVHFYFYDNFCKFRPIFIIYSIWNSEMNCGISRINFQDPLNLTWSLRPRCWRVFPMWIEIFPRQLCIKNNAWMLDFYRVTLCVSAVLAVERCLSVRLSVTRRYCVQTIVTIYIETYIKWHQNYFGAATLHRATLNRATVKRRQFTGRQLTGASDNRVPFHRVTLHRAGRHPGAQHRN